jgi:photosystem II stability/assembly factor-like uncharacterized protein
MIKFIIEIFAFLSLYPQLVLCQTPLWKTLSQPPADSSSPYSYYEDVYFLNNLTGWTSTLHGKVYKTTDSGSSWTLIFDDESKVFYRTIIFADETEGWSATSRPNRVLYHTTDGGYNWNAINVNLMYNANLESICLINDTTIYTCGAAYYSPQFAKSTNSGLNWIVTDLGLQMGGVSDIYFFNRDSGFAAGCYGVPFDTGSPGVILFTSNGGQNWVNRYTTAAKGVNCWQIFFNKTQSIGGVVLEDTNSYSYFLKTTDRGQTWQEMLFSTTRYISQTLGFINTNTGWIGGSRITTAPVFYTTNGGTSFDTLRWGRSLRRIIFLNDTLGFAAGYRIYKYQINPIGIQISSEKIPLGFNLYQNYPNPFNPATTITIDIPLFSVITLEIYDCLGKVVEIPANKMEIKAGKYEFKWKADNLPSGIYFCRISTEKYSNTVKMILLK